MKKFVICLLLGIFIFLSTACGMSPEEAAQATNVSNTATASAWTPTPTVTPTITPSPTPTPTPMPTPLGESSGQIVFWNPERNNTGDDELNDSFRSMALFDIQSEDVTILAKSDGRSFDYSSSSVSADGKIIYLYKQEENQTSRGSGWNSILYEYNLETGQLRRLSAAPQFAGNDQADYLLDDFNPDVSHDSSMIVFSSNRDYLSSYELITYLYTMDLKTYEISRIPRTVNKALRARFSPDGTQIAYTAWDGDWEIYIQNLDGTNLQKITNNGASDRFPEWSPDGRQLVFHSDRDGNLELYIYDIELEETTRITFDPATDATASWSPDGTMLVYGSDKDGDNDIYCINVDTLEVTKIYNTDDNLGVPIWIP